MMLSCRFHNQELSEGYSHSFRPKSMFLHSSPSHTCPHRQKGSSVVGNYCDERVHLLSPDRSFLKEKR